MPALRTIASMKATSANGENRTHNRRTACVAAAFLWALAPPAMAQQTDWQAVGGGNWNAAGNWTNGVPNGNQAIARLLDSINNSPAKLNVTAATVVRDIQFNNSQGRSYEVALNGGTLTFDNGLMGAQPKITVPAANTADHSITADIRFLSSTEITNDSQKTLTISGAITGNNLSKFGSGKLTLTGNNGHSGNFLNGGTTEVGADNAFGAANASVRIVDSVLRTSNSFASNRQFHFGALAGTGAIIDTNGKDLTLGGTILNDVFGGKLTKRGDGILKLTAANGWSEGAVIDGGKLIVSNQNGSGTGNGPITVNVGGTLGGKGNINGKVTVKGGADIRPGESAGVLKVGDLELEPTSACVVELDGPSSGEGSGFHDQLDVTGTVVLDGSILSGVLSYVPSANDKLFIVKNDLGDSVTGQFAQGNSLTLQSSADGQFYTFAISYAGNEPTSVVGGNDVVLYNATMVGSVPSVPALSGWAMIVLIALLVLSGTWMIRRRQRPQAT